MDKLPPEQMAKLIKDLRGTVSPTSVDADKVTDILVAFATSIQDETPDDQIKILKDCVENIRKDTSGMTRNLIFMGLANRRAALTGQPGPKDFLLAVGEIIWEQAAPLNGDLTKPRVSRLLDLIVAKKETALRSAAKPKPAVIHTATPVTTNTTTAEEKPMTFFGWLTDLASRIFATIRGWFGFTTVETNARDEERVPSTHEENQRMHSSTEEEEEEISNAESPRFANIGKRVLNNARKFYGTAVKINAEAQKQKEQESSRSWFSFGPKTTNKKGGDKNA